MSGKEQDSASLSGPSLRQILQKHEEQLMDFEKNICLLCKRVFRTIDHIRQHRMLSELHSARLKKLKTRLFTGEQLERLEKREREALYRDRAKERRLKYGQPDRLISLEPICPSLDESPALSSRGVDVVDTSAKPLGRENKGAALLAKMGWKEGTGLGRSNEGMTNIIKLESQVGTSGLGSKSYKLEPNMSYKDAVKHIMYKRYHELSDEEGEG